MQNFDISTYRKKLNVKARRRGIKELDLIMEQFVENNLSSLNHKDLQDFDNILNQEDSDLLLWLLNTNKFPSNLNKNLWNLILQYKNPYIDKKS